MPADPPVIVRENVDLVPGGVAQAWPAARIAGLGLLAVTPDLE